MVDIKVHFLSLLGVRTFTSHGLSFSSALSLSHSRYNINMRLRKERNHRTCVGRCALQHSPYRLTLIRGRASCYCFGLSYETWKTAQRWLRSGKSVNNGKLVDHMRWYWICSHGDLSPGRWWLMANGRSQREGISTMSWLDIRRSMFIIA